MRRRESGSSGSLPNPFGAKREGFGLESCGLDAGAPPP
jgi:hypothetical protein